MSSAALVRVVTERRADFALQLLDERELANLEMYAAEVEAVTALLKVKPLESLAESHQVTEIVARGKTAMNGLEALRRSKTDPLNAEVKNINDLFRPLTEALVKLEATGKGLIAKWQQQDRIRQQREAEERARKEQEAIERETAARAKAEAAQRPDLKAAADAEADEAVRDQIAIAIAATPPTPRVLKSDSGTASGRKVWKFEVLGTPDHEDPAMRIPARYLVPDEKAIRAAVANGVRAIPGVHIYEEDAISIRTR